MASVIQDENCPRTPTSRYFTDAASRALYSIEIEEDPARECLGETKRIKSEAAAIFGIVFFLLGPFLGKKRSFLRKRM